MKKITLFLITLFVYCWQINAQSVINITTSGGIYTGEKWVSVTTAVNGGGTLIWGQGDGTQCNGAGLINQDITIAPGTYYVNCYDQYDDNWDGTLISVTAYGNVIGNNGGVSPDDGEDTDASTSCEGTPEELEASFMIVVPNPPACLSPTALTATNVTATSADLGWTAGDSETLWDIEIVNTTAGGTATGTPTATGVNANSYSATGLTPDNNYAFYVRADCVADGTSTWAGPFAFTTLIACQQPTALTATNVTATSADLGWTAGDSETLWDIEVVDVTAGGTATGTPTATGVNANSYSATGLTPDNNYAFYVRADCVVDGTSTWAGPFAFTTLIACQQPTAQTATNIMTTSADLGWTAGGSETLWDIEVVDVTAGGTATGTPTATGVNTNSYSATGLTPNNNYAFYVRADCAGDGTSTWSGPFSFTTDCLPIAAPYTEDFEAFTTSDLAFIKGNCWKGTGGTYFWKAAPGSDTGSSLTGPNPSITTGNYFYTEASNGASGDTTDLISPSIDLSALTEPSLQFNYHMYGSRIGTLDVLVNGTTSVWSLSGQQQTMAASPWELAVIDLSAYAGQTIKVTFRGTSAGTYQGDIAIDNVAFGEMPACPNPSMLTVTNITSATADLGWTENGSVSAWDIEIVDITAGGMATGTPTVTGVTNPYTAMGLTENNDYTFYVRSNCGGGTTSSWVGPFSFSTMMLCPAPTTLTFTSLTETTVDLGWTAGGSETLWDIEVVDVTAGGMATGTPTVTGVTTNSYSVTGLTANNDYQCYVRADCGANGTSLWAGPVAFRTGYCVPSGTYSSTYINTFSTTGATGDNINNTGSGFSAGNYGDNYATATVRRGQGQDINFNVEIVSGSVGCAIWVDWNSDFVFDTSELVFSTTSYGNGPFTGTFTTPAAVANGDYRMRVMIDYNDSNPGDDDACSFGTDRGEVEDYKLVIDSSLGIESAAVRGFVHYVNTNTNSFVVNAQNTIASIEVYNLVGQTIAKVAPNAAEGKAYLGSAKNGVYFAKVTLQNGRTSVVKFVK